VSAAERTRWGWHQLTEDYASRLVERAGIRAGDLVLDIGAGTGAVTAALVAAGARVLAVELHRGRASILKAKFANASVTVVRADAADLLLPKRPFRVVSNPPFAITTAVLRRLVAPGSRLVRADIVVPAFTARRWANEKVAGAGRWRALYAAIDAGRVPPRAFRPAGPAAALLVLARKDSPIRT
jgi:23S rRNA (adenine-N6)-dimethyltransferase